MGAQHRKLGVCPARSSSPAAAVSATARPVTPAFLPRRPDRDAGRWRRLGDGGSRCSSPSSRRRWVVIHRRDEFRASKHNARAAPRACVRTSSVRTALRVRRVHRRGERLAGLPRALRNTVDDSHGDEIEMRGRVHTRSVHDPQSTAGLRAGRTRFLERLRPHSGPLGPARTWVGGSPPATWSTTSTGQRSPPPAPAVRPRLDAEWVPARQPPAPATGTATFVAAGA